MFWIPDTGYFSVNTKRLVLIQLCKNQVCTVENTFDRLVESVTLNSQLVIIRRRYNYVLICRSLLSRGRTVSVHQRQSLILKVAPWFSKSCANRTSLLFPLAAMKSKLATIASVHVYSIQKALLKDSGPLYNTDYDIVKTNLHDCSKWVMARFCFLRSVVGDWDVVTQGASAGVSGYQTCLNF